MLVYTVEISLTLFKITPNIIYSEIFVRPIIKTWEKVK